MCGIFGFFDTNNSDIFYDLGKYSETRGKEASGFMNISKNNQVIYKFPLPFSDKKVGISIKKDHSKNASNSYIGHTRLKTHGNEEQDENNQPVFSEDISIVHNGIVVNYQKILKDFNLKLSSELDSEIIVLLLDYYLKNSNINEALPQTIENLSGEVSIAGTYKKGEYFFLYTNTGSIYYVLNKNKLMYFSSEEWITKKIKSKYKIAGDIYKLEANNGLIFDSNYLKINNFFQECLGEEFKKPSLDEIIQTFKKKEIVKPVLKRCNKCILPDTVPFIFFDEDGICNYCINYTKHEPKNISKLIERLKTEETIVVGFSGGRDSSYGLSYLNECLESNFVAVSYDWGMITDLARRNQARVSGKLGVEHVWVSADINKKRENIKKNFLAWLSKPDLGMVPILMAGDKEWQKQLFNAAKNKNTNYVVQFVSPFEFTYFKYGFAGIRPFFTAKIQKLNFITKYFVTIKLSIFYLKNFFKNPRYLNSTLFDTLKGFFSYFFQTKNIISLFEYLEYIEDDVNNHLVKKFSWELDPSTPTTWRIGDGTASVYNYIYWLHAGFTENDFFRSNQIRQGHMSRSQALEKIHLENQPRLDEIRKYCELIDIDYDFVIETLESMKKNSLVGNWKIEK